MEPRHPVRNGPLTDLERCLWRFRMAALESQVMWRGFGGYEDVGKSINKDLLFSLTNQALIIVSKFLEVWDDFGPLAKADERVRSTRRAVQPVVDRIGVWPGLPTFRNTTLAHAYTTKSGALLPPWELLEQEKVPTYHAEILLLLHLVHLGTLAILTVFQSDFEALKPLTVTSGRVLGPGPGIAVGTSLKPALRTVLEEVDKLLKDHCKVEVGGTLAQEFKNALDPKAA